LREGCLRTAGGGRLPPSCHMVASSIQRLQADAALVVCSGHVMGLGCEILVVCVGSPAQALAVRQCMSLVNSQLVQSSRPPAVQPSPMHGAQIDKHPQTDTPAVCSVAVTCCVFLLSTCLGCGLWAAVHTIEVHPMGRRRPMCMLQLSRRPISHTLQI